jgi:hypothetical protein
MVNNLFSNASRNGFNVVRVWGFTDVGNADGSNSVDGIKEGVYFQYWDGSKPAYNDGPNGLQRLDRVVARAVRSLCSRLRLYVRARLAMLTWRARALVSRRRRRTTCR